MGISGLVWVWDRESESAGERKRQRENGESGEGIVERAAAAAVPVVGAMVLVVGVLAAAAAAATAATTTTVANGGSNDDLRSGHVREGNVEGVSCAVPISSIPSSNDHTVAERNIDLYDTSCRDLNDAKGVEGTGGG